jgi:pimeloyl-ACP methyl ester carboxylesterase
MPNVEVNGIALEYAEKGKGQPVIFVHGGSADLRTWNDQLTAFSSMYRAIAISCRGYYPNKALRSSEKITLNTFVEDLAGLIRILQLAPVHLIGHSSPGGFGSLLLAHEQPELLRSLVLVEPPAFSLLGVDIPPKPVQILRLLISDPRIAMGFVRFGARGIGPALKAFERGDDEKGLRTFMKMNLGAEAFDQMPRSRLQQAFENIGPLKAQIRAGFPSFSGQMAKTIQVPILLVSGEKSNTVLQGVTDKLERTLPDVERLNIRNASHNMFESAPEAFNKGVLDFLGKHTG